MIQSLMKRFEKLKNPKKARVMQGFFKIGKGEYGHGDVFLGINVPKQRELAREFRDLEMKDIQKLLKSKVHEHRLTALLILMERYKRAKGNEKGKIFSFYLENTKNVNSWDLVDLSAPNIVGDYLLDKNRNILYILAESKNLWDRRIAVLATFAFIKKYDFCDSLKIAEMLIKDRHDLIHKAVGWMLREIGKRNQAIEEQFLIRHCKSMPRTMLRYALEKFDSRKKAFYMKKHS